MFDPGPNFESNAADPSAKGSAARQVPLPGSGERLESLIRLLYEKSGSSWDELSKKIPCDRTTVFRWLEGKTKPRYYDRVCERIEDLIRQCEETIDSPTMIIHIKPQDEQQPASVKSMLAHLRFATELRAAGLNICSDRALEMALECGFIYLELLPNERPVLLACIASVYSMMDKLDDAISYYEQAVSAAASARARSLAYRYKLSVEYLKADKSWRVYRAANELDPDNDDHELKAEVTACLNAVELEVMPSPTDRSMEQQRDGIKIALLSMLNARQKFIKHVNDMIDRGARQGFDGFSEAKEACKANQYGMYDNALRWLRETI